MKRITCLLTAACLMTQTSALAKIDSASVITDGIVEYSGKIEGVERVSVTVLETGYTIDDFMKSASPDSMIVEYAQDYADADGNYSFNIDLGGKSGTYGVWVGYDKNKAPNEDKIVYINQTKNAEALAALKNDGVNVTEILMTGGADLGIDFDLLSKAVASDYEAAAQILANSVGTSVYEDKIGASENIDKALAIALINSGKATLEDTSDLLMTQASVGKWYKEAFMTKNVTDYITEKIDKNSDNFEKFDNTLAEATALGVIYGASGYGSITTYLKENSEMLDINKSDVSDAFSKSVIGKKFDKFSDIGLEDFKESSSNLSGSSSSGGGGGGGGVKSPAGGKTVAQNNVIPEAIVDEGYQTSAAGSSFSDMTGFEWAAEAVNKLAAENIISGKQEGIFAPSDLVLREEFVKMIMGIGNFEEIYGDIAFEDVNEGDWFYSYVKNAYLCGIVSGFSDTQFGSGYNVIRQDMAVLCYNMLKSKGIFTGLETVNESEYKDVSDISDYAVEAVKVLSSKGILTGDENLKFMPQNNATRAEAAQMIYKTYKLISEYEEQKGA